MTARHEVRDFVGGLVQDHSRSDVTELPQVTFFSGRRAPFFVAHDRTIHAFGRASRFSVTLSGGDTSPQIVIGGLVRRLRQPLGELAHAAQIGLLRPLAKARELEIGEHFLRERREGLVLA